MNGPGGTKTGGSKFVVTGQPCGTYIPGTQAFTRGEGRRPGTHCLRMRINLTLRGLKWDISVYVRARITFYDEHIIEKFHKPQSLLPVYGTLIDYNGELKRLWFLPVRLLRSLSVTDG